MAEYRLYQLDAADHIVAGYSVYCISDRAALAAARRLAERATAVEKLAVSAASPHNRPRQLRDNL
jgi:hypothetical protein